MSNNVLALNSQLPEVYTLEEAATNGHLEGVKRLMEKGARIPFDYGWAILGAARNGHLEIAKYLIEFKDKSFPEEKCAYSDLIRASIPIQSGPLF